MSYAARMAQHLSGRSSDPVSAVPGHLGVRCSRAVDLLVLDGQISVKESEFIHYVYGSGQLELLKRGKPARYWDLDKALALANDVPNWPSGRYRTTDTIDNPWATPNKRGRRHIVDATVSWEAGIQVRIHRIAHERDILRVLGVDTTDLRGPELRALADKVPIAERNDITLWIAGYPVREYGLRTAILRKLAVDDSPAARFDNALATEPGLSVSESMVSAVLFRLFENGTVSEELLRHTVAALRGEP